MTPTFDEVSHRISSIVGLPISPGRWRLVVGRIHADCSASSVVVLIGSAGDDWTVTDVRSAADLEQLAETILNFVATKCIAGPDAPVTALFGH